MWGQHCAFFQDGHIAWPFVIFFTFKSLLKDFPFFTLVFSVRRTFRNDFEGFIFTLPHTLQLSVFVANFVILFSHILFKKNPTVTFILACLHKDRDADFLKLVKYIYHNKTRNKLWNNNLILVVHLTGFLIWNQKGIWLWGYSLFI